MALYVTRLTVKSRFNSGEAEVTRIRQKYHLTSINSLRRPPSRQILLRFRLVHIVRLLDKDSGELNKGDDIRLLMLHTHIDII